MRPDEEEPIDHERWMTEAAPPGTTLDEATIEQLAHALLDRFESCVICGILTEHDSSPKHDAITFSALESFDDADVLAVLTRRELNRRVESEG